MAPRVCIKSEHVMNIAYITVPGRGLIDDCLSKVVALADREGLKLAGTVRANPLDSHVHPCDMDVRVLPDGPIFRISQALGQGAKGCRLDGGAIEGIAAEVERRLDEADVLIVNKFGKQEAFGRGLCAAIARAVEIGLPVIVGVNGLNLSEFLHFADGAAVRLEPDPAAAVKWLSRVCASRLPAQCPEPVLPCVNSKIAGHATSVQVPDL
jgi:hypothetical protein